MAKKKNKMEEAAAAVRASQAAAQKSARDKELAAAVASKKPGAITTSKGLVQSAKQFTSGAEATKNRFDLYSRGSFGESKSTGSIDEQLSQAHELRTYLDRYKTSIPNYSLVRKSVDDNIAQLTSLREQSAVGIEAYKKDSAPSVGDKEYFSALSKYMVAANNALPQGGMSTVNWAFKNDDTMDKPNDTWTAEDREVFGYLYSQGQDKATQYARSRNTAYRQAAQQKESEALSEWAEEHPLLGTAAAVASMPLGMAETWYRINEQSTKGRMDEPGSVTPTQFSNAITGAVANTLNEKSGTLNNDIPVIGGKGLGDVYQLGVSIAQSLSTAYTGGTMGTYAVFFGNAMANGISDAKDRGATDNQAIAFGLCSGFAEAAAEAFSVEKLFTRGAASSMKSLFRNLLKQAGVEASEEGMTTLMNNFADQMVMQDKSNFNIAVREYVAQGMDEEAAKKQAWKDMANDLAYDMLGGFVSGGVSGGVQTGVQTGIQNYDAKHTYGDYSGELVAEALEIDPNNTYAQQMKAKVVRGKKLTGNQLRKLVEQNEAAMLAGDRAAVQSAVETRLLELGEHRDDAPGVAAALTKQVMGEQLTRQEKNAIAYSSYAQRVAHELNPENIEDGTHSTQWAEQIGTNRINPVQYSRGIVQEASESPEAVSETISETETVPAVSELTAPAAVIGSVTEDAVDLNTDDAVIAETAQKYGGAAKSFVDAYNADSSGVSLARFDAAYSVAFNMGKAGVQQSQVHSNPELSVLSAGQREAAYHAGVELSAADAHRQEARNKAGANGKRGRRKGVVRGEAGVSMRELRRRFNDPQNKAYNLLVAYAEATGIDIVLYKSQADESGHFTGAEGRFVWKENTIHLDLNSGLAGIDDVKELSNYTLMRTFGHEFIHFLEKWNPVHYGELKRAVFDRIAEQSERGWDEVHDMIEEQRALDSSGNMSYEEASNEVVAEALADLLPDAGFVQTLAEQHQTVFERLVAKLREFVQQLKEHFAKMAPHKYDGADKLKEEVDGSIRYLESIVQLFDNVAVQAVETYQATVATDEAPKTKKNYKSKTDSAETVAGDALRDVGVFGMADETYTEDDTPIAFEYAVIPADALIVSNDEHGHINPAYPEELQPRDRSRAASQLQISDMSRSLNPRKLEASPTAQNGSPIVRADGVVIGGNARSQAILMAYRTGNADGYESYMREHASRFGIAGELPEHPVLVRVARDADSWRAMSQRLNQSTMASYSATEQAMQDAVKMPDIIDLLRPGEDGNMNAASNRDFIRAFVDRVAAANERTALLTSDGTLSQEGLSRARYAVFAYAYEDAELMQRLSESLDNDARNVTNAMLLMAPEVAHVTHGVKNGTLYDVDMVPTLLDGINLYLQAKSEGTTVDAFVAQGTILDDYGLEVLVAQDIENRKRSGKQVAEYIGALCAENISYGDPDQVGFFEEENHNAEGLLRGTRQRTDGGRIGEAGSSDFETGSHGAERAVPQNDGVRTSQQETTGTGESSVLEEVGQTDSEAFKAWFGNSKAVDKNGKPKIFYHGTSGGGFTVFDAYGHGKFGLFGIGSYFTDNESVAQSYTKKGKGQNAQVYACYLQAENPIDMDAQADIQRWKEAAPDAATYFNDCITNEDCFRELKEYCEDMVMVRYEAEEYIMDVIRGMGYDSITHIGGGRFDSKDETRHRVFIVFEPEQVKSATDNIGTFDRNNPDIRYKYRTAPNTQETEREEIAAIQGIGRRSINEFGPEEIKKTERFARRYWETLGVKSPFFRAWFGDWRAYDITPIEYVSVNSLFVNSSDIPFGDYENDDTGWTVTVNSNGIGKTKNARGVGSAEHRALADLNKMISSAVLLDTVVSSDNSTRIGKTTVLVHHMYCPVLVGGKKAIAKLYITENIQGDHKFYLTKIEEVPHAIGENIETDAVVHRAESTAGETSSTISVAEMFAFVKEHDVDYEADSKHPVYFKPNPVDPALLNADGTPKVFYHQTAADFTVFDTERQSHSAADTEMPRGIFLKSSDANIGLAGSKQMPLYVSVHNTLRFPNREAATNWYIRNIPGYEDALREVRSVDNRYHAEYEDRQDKLTELRIEQRRNKGQSAVANNAVELYRAGIDTLFAEWTAEGDKARGTVRNILDDFFRNSEYDSLYIERDNGSFGRNTDALVVFDKGNVKSASIGEDANIGTFDRGNSDIRYRRRSTVTSDHQVVTATADELDMGELSPAERDALKLFKERSANVQRLQAERAALGALWNQQTFGELLPDGTRGSADREEAKKTLNRREILDAQLERAERDLLKIEQTRVFKGIIKRAREVERKKAKGESRERLALYRESRSETIARNEYKERIRKDVAELNKWILHPSNKDAVKHVPDALKTTVIPFLTSIDFTSKRQLSGGEETKADRAFVKQLTSVKRVLKDELDNGEMYAAYDLPPDFMERLDTFTEQVRDLVDAGGDGFVVNRMSAAELKELSRLIKSLKKAIIEMNRFHSNAMMQHVYEAGDSSIAAMQEIESMKAHGKYAKTAYNFTQWQLIRPAVGFERFGAGGKAIYKGLSNGQNVLARNTKAVLDFAEELYTAEEVREWDRDVRTITLTSGEVVRMPVSSIMSFYELTKRPQGLQHILGGGIRVHTFAETDSSNAFSNALPEALEALKPKVEREDSGHRIVPGDLQLIVGELNERQKHVADEMQKYMAKQGGAWGNHVTMARFGEEMYGEETYWPINSDGKYLDVSVDEQLDAAGLWAMLNQSFTRELNEKANNGLVLYSAFDVFSTHMSSMATYNAFALPVLDTLKWINYKQRDPETGLVSNSVRQEMTRVYGAPKGGNSGSGPRGYAENFVLNVIRSVNGTAKQGSEYDAALMGFLQKHNKAQVAWNARVVIQQPTAIVRAGLYLDAENIAKSAGTTAKRSAKHIATQIGIKAKRLEKDDTQFAQDYAEMLEHSGIALWKDMGFFDLNVSRSMTELIKHEQSAFDKFTEVGMSAASKADQITWTAIWVACKEDVQQKKKLKPGDEGYFDAVTELFEEIIHKTQVVDGALDKCEFMRDRSLGARTFSSFMSESATTFSMVDDLFFNFHLDMRRGLTAQQAWQKHSNIIARGLTVYVVGGALNTLMTALMDAWRDDDEYQEFTEKYVEHFLDNLPSELNPLTKIPIVSDGLDTLKYLGSVAGLDTYGSAPGLALTQIVDYTAKLIEMFTDEDTNYTAYGKLRKALQLMSSVTGVPGAALTREVVTLWNNVVGLFGWDNMIVREYEPKDMTKIAYAYMDGYLSEEEATAELLRLGLASDENDAYWLARKWDNNWEGTKWDSLDEAVFNMENADEAVKELTSHGVNQSSVYSHVKSSAKAWYQNGEISKDQALQMVREYTDVYETDAAVLVDQWTCKIVTGIDFDDIKESYLGGKITKSRAVEMLKLYGHDSADDAEGKARSWEFEKKHGFLYSKRVDAYINGSVSETEMREILSGYGEQSPEEVENNMRAYNWLKRNPGYDLSVDDAKAYTKTVEAIGKSIEDIGVKPDVFAEYRIAAGKCKGVDSDGDGRADMYSKMKQILVVIDDLPISSTQKDALYHLNGWARRNMRLAPWH